MLLDVLVAMLLLAITVWGLMRYQQVLSVHSRLLHNMTLAWRFAHEQLESYPDIHAVVLPEGWHRQVYRTKISLVCQNVTVRIIPSYGKEVVLSRWYCQARGKKSNV